MRLLKIDRRNNLFEVIPESLDDLWHLEKVIEKGDSATGKSERKVKPKYEGGKARKEAIFIDLQVERVEFHKTTGQLRVTGIIVGGRPEQFIELKAHHSLEFTPGRKIRVQKEKLKGYQVERLERAKRASAREKMLLVVLDDEEAGLALLKEFGFGQKGKILAGRQGKRYKGEEAKNKYFEDIIEKVTEVKPEKVIFAGPGFTKNNLKKYLEEKGIKLNAFFESINSVGITGLNELLKGGKIDSIAGKIQIGQETKLVEKLIEEVGKDNGLGEYGLKQIERAAEIGAVQELLVGEEFLLQNREKAEELMDKVEQLRGSVHIISSEHEAGKKLLGIGGIGAILRYRIATSN